jgi:hypothetical protein
MKVWEGYIVFELETVLDPFMLFIEPSHTYSVTINFGLVNKKLS